MNHDHDTGRGPGTWQPQAGPELDAWVALAEGLHIERRLPDHAGDQVFVTVDGQGERPVPRYSRDEAVAQVIIDREGIHLSDVIDEDWTEAEQVIAWLGHPAGSARVCTGSWVAESVAAAAMLCFVASRFGDDWIDRPLPVPQARR